MSYFYHVVLVNPLYKYRQADDRYVSSHRKRKTDIMSCDKVEVSLEYGKI